MSRFLVPILAATVCVGVLSPAFAGTRKVKVPNRYDGAWTIVATTSEGPCAAQTRYQVQIKDSDASIPGDEVDIDGGVSASGSVQATIISGSNTVPIAGSLDTQGAGAGTWRTSGGPITCSGRWNARRSS
ncbi:heme utilization protein [Methylobacterium sp. J-048]|uniref:heme utilization protein n=1 Tax=Methylobacterium sp. J-048 TaxID=2836635 RepID=UPI001FBC0CD8|nr:heme utilization protein [Methylobacterium sp. J-048]MCJ2060792.1 heme utilization protein [Methylobacterium sp. J-048]